MITGPQPAGVPVSGRSESGAVGQPLMAVLTLVDPESRAPVESPVSHVLRGGAGVALPHGTVLVDAYGAEHRIADNGAPVLGDDGKLQGVVLVFRDVTAQEALEREARRAERLASLGRLAAGIARDFNDLLAVATGNVTVVSSETPPGSPAREALDEAASALVGASRLTRQLMAFSGGTTPAKAVASLEDIVREAARFLEDGGEAEISISVAPGLSPIEVDTGQINQVVHSLLNNAVESMPEGGTVTASLANERVGRDAPVPLPKGRYVTLMVADRGPGIPQDHLDRIFDPFFATKHGGSGLGLSSAYAMVRNHGGHLAASSVLGEGTTMWLRLPSALVDAASKRRTTPDDEPARILVMDDDATIRKAIARVLSAAGHSVVEVEDGRGAVEAFSAANATGRPFDLVVLDRAVPGAMGGGAALAAIRTVDPAVPAIVTTGQAADSSLAELHDMGLTAALSKPFDVKTLSGIVTRALDNQWETG